MRLIHRQRNCNGAMLRPQACRSHIGACYAAQEHVPGREPMSKTSEPSFRLALSGQRAPVDYDRAPSDHALLAEKDVLVPMRDGVKIAVDVYRPQTAQKLPALLAFSIHNKDLQGPELAQASLTQPAWSMLWTGPGGSRRHALLRVARLRACDRQSRAASANRRAAARAPSTAMI